MNDNGNENQKEQEEINASFQRIIELETKDLCIMCQSIIESGISFCNARCETQYTLKICVYSIE